MIVIYNYKNTDTLPYDLSSMEEYKSDHQELERL